jgi:hypothetical protein
MSIICPMVHTITSITVSCVQIVRTQAAAATGIVLRLKRSGITLGGDGVLSNTVSGWTSLQVRLFRATRYLTDWAQSLTFVHHLYRHLYSRETRYFVLSSQTAGHEEFMTL